MASMPGKTLFTLYSKDREVLHVTKSPQFQSLVGREWWYLVTYIVVKHYDSYDELEYAKVQALESINQQAEAK
jgi:hypothetical protein